MNSRIKLIISHKSYKSEICFVSDSLFFLFKNFLIHLCEQWCCPCVRADNSDGQLLKNISSDNSLSNWATIYSMRNVRGVFVCWKTKFEIAICVVHSGTGDDLILGNGFFFAQKSISLSMRNCVRCIFILPNFRVFLSKIRV